MAVQDFTTEELENEIWKEVPYYEGFYSISTLGRIRRDSDCHRAKRGYILNPVLDKDGYMRVDLYKGGPAKHWHVHVLVAAAFLGPRPKDKIVNHKDGVKLNCRPDNLEYITGQKNQEHAMQNGLLASGFRSGRYTKPNSVKQGKDHPLVRITPEQTKEVESLIAKGMPHWKIALRFGVSRPVISQIGRGEHWTQRGKTTPIKESQIVEIIHLYQSGMSQYAIAKRLNTSQSLISSLIRKHTG